MKFDVEAVFRRRVSMMGRRGKRWMHYAVVKVGDGTKRVGIKREVYAAALASGTKNDGDC